MVMHYFKLYYNYLYYAYYMMNNLIIIISILCNNNVRHHSILNPILESFCSHNSKNCSIESRNWLRDFRSPRKNWGRRTKGRKWWPSKLRPTSLTSCPRGPTVRTPWVESWSWKGSLRLWGGSVFCPSRILAPVFFLWSCFLLLIDH